MVQAPQAVGDDDEQRQAPTGREVGAENSGGIWHEKPAGPFDDARGSGRILELRVEMRERDYFALELGGEGRRKRRSETVADGDALGSPGRPRDGARIRVGPRLGRFEVTPVEPLRLGVKRERAGDGGLSDTGVGAG